MDPIAREEYESHQKRNLDNETLQVFRDELSHPYDWYCFHRLVERVKRDLLGWTGVLRLVLIGGGTAFEAAMLKREIPAIREVVILDLGFRMLQLAGPTFDHLSVSTDRTLRIVADFNCLPFDSFGYNTVGLAFRCLHHAQDIDRVISEMRRVFTRIIIVEPVWTLPIRLLARIGIANRPEHVEDHRPQRITSSQLELSGWLVEKKYILEIPRDRLPGLQKRQGCFSKEDISPFEAFLSKTYDAVGGTLGWFASTCGFSSYVQAKMVRRAT